jgi:hypothetical protein
MATACGSLPHVDAGEAIDLVLDSLPGLPAAPALPARHPAEGMLGQAAWGLGGVVVGDDGGLLVDTEVLDRDASGVDDAALPAEPFGATLAFFDELELRRWTGPVKIQCTGPVTLGSALVAAGAAPRDAFPAAAAAVRRRARALVSDARRRLRDNTLVFVVDEPSLGRATLGDAPLGVEDAVDLVSGTLGAIEGVAVAGLHCCSVADWGAVLRAGPHLLSLPVDIAGSLRPSDLGPFFERGGWVAWGAVPTSAPLAPVDGGGVPRLWRSLAARWHALADGGVDPVLLRRRALVTPACGLARHDPAQAALALRLTSALGARIAAGTVEVDRRRTGGSPTS